MDNSTLIGNIESLCNQRGIKPNKALVESGAGKDFIYNARNGSEPSVNKIAKLASYFDVSTDYLLGNEQKNKPSAEAESLSNIEKEILRIYANLPEEKQKAFMTVVRALESQSKDK